MCVCIARQIEDGEVIAQGIATPMVLAGYFLAKLTHAPNLTFASALGNTLTTDWAPLSLTWAEDIAIRHAMICFTFTQISCELLPLLHPKEFFRPAQVDPYGNFNNVVIGDYLRPRLRLPGAGGIPDVTPTSPRVYLYNPRHSRAAFVERLDFISGVGVHSSKEEMLPTPPLGPRYMVTDLGQFDFANGRMRLVTYHRGVSIEDIQRRTGFPLDVAPDVHETPGPMDEEIRLLREVIDPMGLRRIEMLGGQERWALLRTVAEKERTIGGPTR